MILMEVFFVWGKKVHYPAEIKWKVVEMKHQGFKNKEIMDALGIRHVAQIKNLDEMVS